MAVLIDEYRERAFKVAHALDRLMREALRPCVESEEAQAEATGVEQLKEFEAAVHSTLETQLASQLRAFDSLFNFIAEQRPLDLCYQPQTVLKEFDQAAQFCSSERCCVETFQKWAEQQQPPYALFGFSSTTIDLLQAISEEIWNSGQPGEAADLYRLLSTLDPNAALNWYKWGLAALDAERYAEALAPFTFLQSADAGSPIPLYYLALCYYQLQEYQLGDNALQEALEICQRDRVWEETLALCHELKKTN